MLHFKNKDQRRRAPIAAVCAEQPEDISEYSDFELCKYQTPLPALWDIWAVKEEREGSLNKTVCHIECVILLSFPIKPFFTSEKPHQTSGFLSWICNHCFLIKVINPCRCVQSPLPSGACAWFQELSCFYLVCGGGMFSAADSSSQLDLEEALSWAAAWFPPHRFKDWPTSGVLDDCGSVCRKSLQYIDFCNSMWPAPFLHKLHSFYINFNTKSHCSKQFAIQSVGSHALQQHVCAHRNAPWC